MSASQNKKIIPLKPLIEPTPAEKALAEIKADARKDAEKYLRETVVPEGGE